MGHHRCRPPVIIILTQLGEDAVLPWSLTVPHEVACISVWSHACQLLPAIGRQIYGRIFLNFTCMNMSVRQLAVLCSRAGGRPLLCALVWAQPGQSATGSHDWPIVATGSHDAPHTTPIPENLCLYPLGLL